jgi:hypothetical protein
MFAWDNGDSHVPQLLSASQKLTVNEYLRLCGPDIEADEPILGRVIGVDQDALRIVVSVVKGVVVPTRKDQEAEEKWLKVPVVDKPVPEKGVTMTEDLCRSVAEEPSVMEELPAALRAAG